MATPSKQDLGNSLDLVDIKGIKEDTVMVNDGSLRQIIMVGGVNFALKSDSEQNILIQGYQNFLNGLDFPLQILVHSRKVNIDKYIETLAERRAVETSPILQGQISEYVEFIKGFVQKNAIMEKTFLVVVPFYPIASSLPGAKSASGIFSLFGKKKPSKEADAKKAEEAEKTFQENLAQLNQRSTQVTSGLLGIGLEATLLGYDELIELFYNFYNPQTVERKTAPTSRE